MTSDCKQLIYVMAILEFRWFNSEPPHHEGELGGLRRNVIDKFFQIKLARSTWMGQQRDEDVKASRLFQVAVALPNARSRC